MFSSIKHFYIYVEICNHKKYGCSTGMQANSSFFNFTLVHLRIYKQFTWIDIIMMGQQYHCWKTGMSFRMSWTLLYRNFAQFHSGVEYKHLNYRLSSSSPPVIQPESRTCKIYKKSFPITGTPNNGIHEETNFPLDWFYMEI